MSITSSVEFLIEWPFYLRHECYEPEKHIKQSLLLFGRRADEQGTQIFILKYFNFQTNSKFEEDLKFYKAQESNSDFLIKESYQALTC